MRIKQNNVNVRIMRMCYIKYQGLYLFTLFTLHNNTIFIAKMFSILCVAANTSTYIVQHSGGACLKRFAQDVV